MQGKLGDGSLFDIPRTRNVAQTLLSLSALRSHAHLVIIATLIVQISAFIVLPSEWAKWIFLAYFAGWRLAYNGGLGYVLHKQSSDKWIVKVVRSNGWLDNSIHPRLATWIEKELQASVDSEYSVKSAPLELSIWLSFRIFVDLLLLNDFTSYCLFAWSWYIPSQGHFWSAQTLRWIFGWTLIALNLVVKLDAHRVVTDLAWYWSDAFFLPTQDLIFDGVFEMAPHPMYSIGYAGYYGLSLVIGSYTVFFVSVMAHLAQFIFLAAFENPHIDRIYGSRKFIGRESIDKAFSTPGSASHSADEQDKLTEQTTTSSLHDMNNTYFYKDPIFLRNIDPYRAKDFLFMVTIFYASISSCCLVLSPRHRQQFLLLQAIAWRLFHSVGLGTVLHRQSQNQWFVRHFMKHYFYQNQMDIAVIREAFSNWTGLYNFSLTMTYTSFVLLVASHTHIRSGDSVQHELFRVTIGSLLIGLHVWTARETYKTLGSFGWFYGDFFIHEYPKSLSYTGIYRFLNNPERVLGGAAFVGLSLFTDSRIVWAAAIFSVLAHTLFLQLVERPHMHKLYGKEVRLNSGLSNAIRKLGGSDNSALVGSVVELLWGMTGMLANAIHQYLHIGLKCGSKLQQCLSKLSQLLDENLAGYRIRLPFIRTGNLPFSEKDQYTISLLRNEGNFASACVPTYLIGAPISVSWSAPIGHSRADWIGIYRLGANRSAEITTISSRNRWLGIYPEEWSGDIHIASVQSKDHLKPAAHGVCTFATTQKLPDLEGEYELRYHHNSGHGVLQRSRPFRLQVARPVGPDNEANYRCLLLLIKSSLHHEAELLPPACFKSTSLDDSLYQDNNFLLPSAKEAELIAYSINIAFEVDLAPSVILAAANVLDLLHVINSARAILANGHVSAAAKQD